MQAFVRARRIAIEAGTRRARWGLTALAPPMHERSPQPSPAPRLAQAFLALGDDDAAATRPRSPLLGLATLGATVVLALSAPLAWAAAPAPEPPDQPAATPFSKAALPAPDDDGPDGAV
jgi:hypothetical protein